ncbi:hypothetical protein, partial [Loktanella salsilacus]|uniref:hypothetical protein n=1 Tax=Loktanella salsilacus TaxID=195913 RepID=UPI003568DF33
YPASRRGPYSGNQFTCGATGAESGTRGAQAAAEEARSKAPKDRRLKAFENVIWGSTTNKNVNPSYHSGVKWQCNAVPRYVSMRQTQLTAKGLGATSSGRDFNPRDITRNEWPRAYFEHGVTFVPPQLGCVTIPPG